MLAVPLMGANKKASSDLEDNKDGEADQRVIGVFMFINKTYVQEDDEEDDDAIFQHGEAITVLEPNGDSRILMVTEFSEDDQERLVGLVEAAGLAIKWVQDKTTSSGGSTAHVTAPSRRCGLKPRDGDNSIFGI